MRIFFLKGACDTKGKNWQQGLSSAPKASHQTRFFTRDKLWYQLTLLDMQPRIAAAMKPGTLSRPADHTMHKILHICLMLILQEASQDVATQHYYNYAQRHSCLLHSTPAYRPLPDCCSASSTQTA
jgi:hypothetical protein